MAGANQHFIPQSIQRCFRAGGEGKKAWLYLFEKGSEPRPELTRNVGAEKHFYSEPDANSGETLDDRITFYERRRLARILGFIRSAADGKHVDAADAAELVDHLTVRSAHLRRSFTEGAELIAKHAVGAFSDASTLDGLIGEDGDTATPLFRQIMEYMQEKQPVLQHLDIPQSVLDRVVRTYIDENRENLVEDMKASFTSLRGLVGKLDSAARAGHNAGLASHLGHTRKRAEVLGRLTWNVVTLPREADLILPDCVAIANVAGGSSFLPLNLADIDDVTLVTVPIARRRMLIGRKGDTQMPDWPALNRESAACSHSFFVAANCDDTLKALSGEIGKQNQRAIETAVSDAISDLEVTLNPPSSSTGREPARDLPPVASVPLASYAVRFRDCADEETARRISAEVSELVRSVGEHERLDRLDGFTFAYDYAAALRELDRGFEARQDLVPRNDSLGVGVARAPLVIRDGVSKRHIVIHGAFAHALIGERDPERMEATYLLVFELMHVAWHQEVDEAFSGSGFQVHDSYEAILYPHIDGIATAYFAARRSAPLIPDRGDTLREYVAAALASASEAIQNEKPVFRLDGNVEPLAHCAFRHLGDVMELAAQLMGHCDGLAGGTESLAGEPLSAKLRQLGLIGWFKRLQNELRKIYDRRGRWASSEEFVRLNRALERALWAFGMIPWKLPDGRMWVRVV